MKLPAALTLPLLAMGNVALCDSADARPAEPLQFGTLMTVAERASEERAAGTRIAHIDLGWRDIESQDGQWNMDVVRNFRSRIQKLRAAGLKIELGFGIHYWPRWLHAKYPESSYYVNQWGEKAPNELNMVFSQDVRREIEEYVRFVRQHFGTDFWAVRAGIDEAGEYLYPHHDKSQSGRPNSFWGYDEGATRGRGLSIGLRRSPLPDFKPTVNEKQFTNAQARQWYAWYLDSLAGAINWQIALYERLGFKGHAKVLFPGTGFWPNRYNDILARNLNASEYDDLSRDLIARGAYFPETIPRLMKKPQVVVTSTALGIGTGDDCGCEAGDDRVDINAAAVRDWSSSRWVASLARRNGFPLHGESAGFTIKEQTINGQVGKFVTKETLAAVVRQARSCRMDVLVWAFSFRFYDTVEGQPFWPSLRDYEQNIRLTGAR